MQSSGPTIEHPSSLVSAPTGTATSEHTSIRIPPERKRHKMKNHPIIPPPRSIKRRRITTDESDGPTDDDNDVLQGDQTGLGCTPGVDASCFDVIPPESLCNFREPTEKMIHEVRAKYDALNGNSDSIITDLFQIIQYIQDNYELSDVHPLNMKEFCAKESMNGHRIKSFNLKKYGYCTYCGVFVGEHSEENGNFIMGVPIIDTDFLDSNAEAMRAYRRRWVDHKKRENHKQKMKESLLPDGGDKYETEIQILSNLFQILLEMKQSYVANHNYSVWVLRAHQKGYNIGNQPHSTLYINDMIKMMWTKVLSRHKVQTKAILPATLHPPSINMTVDKGDVGLNKLEMGRIQYFSVEQKQFVSAPIICYHLHYRNGEISGSAETLSNNYARFFYEEMEFERSFKLNSIATDNEYFNKGIIGKVQEKYGTKWFGAFRDMNHNINLMLVLLYKQSGFALALITEMRVVIAPFNRKSVVSLQAKDKMGKAALNIATFAVTKWAKHQGRTHYAYYWMGPSLRAIYRQKFEDNKPKRKNLKLTAEQKKVLKPLQVLHCGGTVCGNVLIQDIGILFAEISLKNQARVHEPWEQLTEKTLIIDTLELLVDEQQQLCDDFQSILIPTSLSYLYPNASLIHVNGNKLRVEVDIRYLNRRLPSLLHKKKPKKMDDEERGKWQKKVQQREKQRNLILDLFTSFSGSVNLHVAELHRGTHCNSCDIKDELEDLIECNHCHELSHLSCNGIKNKSYIDFGANNPFYCTINKCKEYKKNRKKNKKKKSKEKKKKSKPKYTDYKNDMEGFLGRIHNEHLNVLKILLNGAHSYLRLPKIVEFMSKCFDFKIIRFKLHQSFGNIFVRYIQSTSKKEKRKIAKCEEFNETKRKLKCVALSGFIQLVKLYNVSAFEDKYDETVMICEYKRIFEIVWYLSWTKQLAFRWNEAWIHKKKAYGKKSFYYKPSNDLTDAILNDPGIYLNNHGAVHLYEKCVSMDACEPDIESDILVANKLVDGRHSLDAMIFKMEYLVKNDVNEFDDETASLLRECAVDWREDHS